MASLQKNQRAGALTSNTVYSQKINQSPVHSFDGLEQVTNKLTGGDPAKMMNRTEAIFSKGHDGRNAESDKFYGSGQVYNR